MLRDVLEATSKAKNLAGILVVTSEGEAMGLAKQFGAEVLVEKTSCGLNAAIKRAGNLLTDKNYAGMIIIPGDVPLVQSTEIDDIIANHGTAPAVSIAPAWDQGGTNAMVSTPADVIDLCFGVDSYNAHIEAAKRAGLDPETINAPGLELDIDTPDDITAFLKYASQTRTSEFLGTILFALILKRGLG
jgi:2-phospho-L-lactate guanylyltransferase